MNVFKTPTSSLVDQLGILKAQIADAEAKANAIKAELVARLGDGAAAGEFFQATVTLDVPRSTVDRKTLEQLIEADLLDQVTKTTFSNRVLVTARHNTKVAA